MLPYQNKKFATFFYQHLAIVVLPLPPFSLSHTISHTLSSFLPLLYLSLFYSYCLTSPPLPLSLSHVLVFSRLSPILVVSPLPPLPLSLLLLLSHLSPLYFSLSLLYAPSLSFSLSLSKLQDYLVVVRSKDSTSLVFHA